MENHFFKKLSIVLFTIVAIFSLNSCIINITEPKIISALEITNLTSRSTAEGNIILEWDNPLNSKFDGVEISYISSGIKKNFSLDKNTNTYIVYGLTKDVIFTSTVKAVDLSGKTTTGMTVEGTPRITKLNNIIIDAENHLRQIPENDNTTKIILKYNGCCNDISIRYTTDGSEVTESSSEYLDSTIIKPTNDNPKITVKAKAFKQGVLSELSEKTYYKVTITFDNLDKL